MKMNYKETTEYLFSQLPVFQKVGGEAYKPGLGNTEKLDKIFNHPHLAYKTIHVGGTNGKGSTSHTLAAVLQQAGYKVGLYTSPHLVDFRERIRVNGEKIAEQYVIDFVDLNRSKFEPVEASFFELTMMMAFCYFREQKVDIAIIEVGLGGRLDSTNIITPELSVITNIGLDHVQFLGDTIRKIATEKAGIIKPNVPVVIGESSDEIRDIFSDRAKEVDTRIVFAEDTPQVISSQLVDNKWFYTTPMLQNIEGELGGLAQLKNANTIMMSIEELRMCGFNISDQAIYSGFKNVCELTGLMGRWQVIQNNPKVVCDTAHNKDGVKYVAQQLAITKCDKLHIIIGFANDKDVTHIVEMFPKQAEYYFVNAQIIRALPVKDLQIIAQKQGLHGKVYSTIKEAYTQAIENAEANDLIFVGGSNFVVGEFLEGREE